MPELPEVEMYRREFEKKAQGKTIQHLSAPASRLMKSSEDKLRKAFQQQQFVHSRRIGKQLLLEAANHKWLAVHFGMTGKFKYQKTDKTPPKYIKMAMEFTDGTSAYYVNSRGFGEINLVEDEKDFIKKKKLGIDAMEISQQDFIQLLQKHPKANWKPVLMNQSIIAGLGNVYVDELLFRCRLHPLSPVAAVSEKQLGKMYDEMRYLLQALLDSGAKRKKMSDTWLVHARKMGAECPRHNGTIEMITVNGRSTYFCPVCQKQG
ncbi:MAG: DNA-formamidopyrimidine glycosylase family protein [Chitinophagales bacterium]|nr:DNA-formamidopyrimidine glycosylase family protein [Chitinophagales bacterium]